MAMKMMVNGVGGGDDGGGDDDDVGVCDGVHIIY